MSLGGITLDSFEKYALESGVSPCLQFRHIAHPGTGPHAPEELKRLSCFRNRGQVFFECVRIEHVVICRDLLVGVDVCTRSLEIARFWKPPDRAYRRDGIVSPWSRTGRLEVYHAFRIGVVGIAVVMRQYRRISRDRGPMPLECPLEYSDPIRPFVPENRYMRRPAEGVGIQWPRRVGGLAPEKRSNDRSVFFERCCWNHSFLGESAGENRAEMLLAEKLLENVCKSVRYPCREWFCDRKSLFSQRPGKRYLRFHPGRRADTENAICIDRAVDSTPLSSLCEQCVCFPFDREGCRPVGLIHVVGVRKRGDSMNELYIRQFPLALLRSRSARFSYHKKRTSEYPKPYRCLHGAEGGT